MACGCSKGAPLPDKDKAVGHSVKLPEKGGSCDHAPIKQSVPKLVTGESSVKIHGAKVPVPTEKQGAKFGLVTAKDGSSQLLSVEILGRKFFIPILVSIPNNGDLISAETILQKLLSVDGAGSGLDAEFLNGNGVSYFSAVGHGHSMGDVSGLSSAIGALLSKSANLSDLVNPSLSRDNLGLGTLATQNGTFSGTSSGINTGDQTITLTGDVTGTGTGSFAATLANTAVTPGSYTFANITVDAKGRITAASSGTAFNGTVGATTPNTGAFTTVAASSTITQTTLSLGPTPATPGLTLINTTAAISGTQQAAPPLRFEGRGFASSGGGDTAVPAQIVLLPVQGTTAPSWTMQFQNGIGGSYTNVMTLTSAGALAPTGGITGGSFVLAASTSALGWNTRSFILSPANGKIQLSNNAQTNGVVLDFSTTGTLKVRNYADSADGSITASSVTATNGSFDATASNGGLVVRGTTPKIAWNAYFALWALSDGVMRLTNDANSAGVAVNVGTDGVLKIRDRANSADGAITVSSITASLPIVYPDYTVATVPAAASWPRGVIWVNNESGGATLAMSNGTDWRRVHDRAIIS